MFFSGLKELMFLELELEESRIALAKFIDFSVPKLYRIYFNAEKENIRPEYLRDGFNQLEINISYDEIMLLMSRYAG